jgi:hypothetical protein
MAGRGLVKYSIVGFLKNRLDQDKPPLETGKEV